MVGMEVQENIYFVFVILKLDTQICMLKWTFFQNM